MSSWPICPSYITEQSCYTEDVVFDVSTFAFYEQTANDGEIANIDDVLTLGVQSPGGEFVGSDALQNWSTRSAPGTPTVTFTFNKPVNVSLAINSLLVSEQVTLLTQPSSYEPAATGVSVAPIFVGPASDNVFHNNNNALPVIVNFTHVEEITFEMLHNAGANATVTVSDLSYTRTHNVTCYEKESGAAKTFASSCKGDLREVDPQNLPANWVECDTRCKILDYTLPVIPYQEWSLDVPVNDQPGAIDNQIAREVVPLAPNVGDTATLAFDFYGQDDCLIPAEIDFTRLSAGNEITRFDPNFNRILNVGADDWRVTIRLLSDGFGNTPLVDWILQPSQMNGTEEFVVEFGTDTLPDDYIQGPGAPAVTLPLAATLVWGNGNNVNPSAFRYNGHSEISFRINGQANVSNVVNIALLTGPDSLRFEPCETVDVVSRLSNITSPTVTTRIIYSEEYFARTANGLIQSGNRNLTITRTAVGLWTAVLATAHPNGVDYHPTITAEEQATRDTPDITIVQGSQTPTGFDIQVTTGDNGATADLLVDTPFTVGISAPVTVVTG